MDITKDWIYDIETYHDAFTFSIVRADGKFPVTIECSYRKNEFNRLLSSLKFLSENECRMVGFNNKGFDYPVIHKLYEKAQLKSFPKTGEGIAKLAFKIAQDQIESMKDSMGFGNTIKTEEEIVPQVDLYRIWHFNNRAKATSLKMLEFNMRMHNIEDLPYDIYEKLDSEKIDKICSYNMHDVNCTLEFYKKSVDQIQFRDDLSIKLGKDFTNADDTKIGAEFFQMKLADAGVKLKKFVNGKLVLNQTKRDKIYVKDCLFNYYKFSRPEFQAVYDWFKAQVITETKGVFSDLEEHELGDVAKYAELEVKRVKLKGDNLDKQFEDFKKTYPLAWLEIEELKATEYAFDSEGNHILEYPLDADGSPNLSKKPKKKRVPKKSYWACRKIASTLNVVVDGFRIDFGVGGIHGSLSEKIVNITKRYRIRDADVSSMYPNIAISNRVYPEHLAEIFCDIYEEMYHERKSHPKGSSENAMLKLALNGTYGKSNDKYSVFYDPKFTMTITINGQLSLLMLADRLLQIKGMKIVQMNTDGITVAYLEETEKEYESACKEWQNDVKLELEFADYSKMIIRDVNNYIALYTNGKVKRKGAYQYEDLGWHQNQSALVIPMAAEANMLYNKDIREFVIEHFNKGNIFDFMLRTKVDRSSRLVLVVDEKDVAQQRICRYYPSKNGGKLVKIMQPLEGKTEDRRLSIDSEYTVKTCNNMDDFDGDIDFDYYVNEAMKLVIKSA